MKSNTLLKILNIRPGESWLVSQLFFLQFFQGAGIALFYTAATALFLERHEIHELPKVYLLAAAILLLAGYLYSKAEHALPVKKLIGGVILFMALSVGLFRLGVSWGLPGWSLYLMTAWYYVLYLLGNLEFWGLSALLFDVRQSKRLFGVISAGDIPAKLIGYFSAYLIVPVIGTADVLYIAMAAIALSLVFWYRLQRSGHLDIHVDHGNAHEHQEAEANLSISKLVKGFFGSELILSVATLSFVVVAVSTMVSFTFYAEVKERMHEHSNADLAAFIGLFLSVGRLVALVVKLLFTGKLTNALGIRGSLLITPSILFVAIAVVAFSPALSESSKVILYSFGIMAVLSETLKASIQDPVFIAVMQPLRHHLRLRGHTIVKGITDPFALAFSSAVLFAVMHFSHEEVDMTAISYILLSMILAWVALIFWVDKKYLSTLIESLASRYVNGREVDISADSVLRLLLDRMLDASTGEAIYLLSLVDKEQGDFRTGMLRRALARDDDRIRSEAIRIAGEHKLEALLPDIERLISAHPSRQVADAIQAACIIRHEEDVDDFSGYLDHTDLIVVKASVIGLMKNGSINAIVSAGQKLQQLRDSRVDQERQIAAEIIGELRVKSFYKSLMTLLQDENGDVVQAAIKAAGYLQNGKLATALAPHLYVRSTERMVLEAWQVSGDMALPVLDQQIRSTATPKNLRLKLIHLLGKLGTAGAKEMLLAYLGIYPDYADQLYTTLHMCRYEASAEHRSTISALIDGEFAFARDVQHLIWEAERTGCHPALGRALDLEFSNARTRILYLLSFIHDRKTIDRAINGFAIHKKESIANAYEIIDLTTDKKTASAFNAIFEKKQSLKTNGNDMPAADILRQILCSPLYNSWSKVVAMYYADSHVRRENAGIISSYQSSDEPILRETSTHIVKQTQNSI